MKVKMGEHLFGIKALCRRDFYCDKSSRKMRNTFDILALT